MYNDVLEGAKVLLRPITLEDTGLIVKWRNNPLVRKNFIFRHDFTNEMHTKWFQEKVCTGDVVQYIIVDKATKRPIGSIYFRDIDRVNESAEYGIFIGEDDLRGKGFGTEAAKLFLKFGFHTMHLHRIYLRVLAENEGAEKSYIKAGFRTEGIFHDMVKIDGKYCDVVFMACFANED